ncbi:MAG TPA: NAD(P)H-hydrate dehydratase [Acidimicrobiia bacterium]
MKPVITPDESAKLDAAADAPIETLMERAGLAVAVAAAEMGARYGSRVAVLCGRGNNGGDGYVAAAELVKRGAMPVIHALGTPPPGSAAEWAALRAASRGVRVVQMGAPLSVDLVIDAVFGVGFHGELPDEARRWAESRQRVLAVDVPSGLDAATGEAGSVFSAERTVTFHALKPGHLVGRGPDLCGAITVADIGLLGGEAILLVAEDGDAPRPARPRSAHKWSAGSVAVVGGSPGLTGAVVLAARAALGAGAGAAAMIVPATQQPIAACATPQVMSVGLGGDRFAAEDAPAVVAAAERFDVMVLGPGLGTGGGAFVSEILRRRSGAVVLDADGLNALDGTSELAGRSGATIITPHAGEYARLVGEEAGWHSAATLADAAGIVVVLKGNPTFVLGSQRWAVTSGGPELATIGTGDVLAGAIAALWARGLAPEVAARSAAHWHGRAGAVLAASAPVTADRLASEIGRWVV